MSVDFVAIDVELSQFFPVSLQHLEENAQILTPEAWLP